MKKCKCGNALGLPLVNPRQRMFVPIGQKEPVLLVYNGGMSVSGQCWFCTFPR